MPIIRRNRLEPANQVQEVDLLKLTSIDQHPHVAALLQLSGEHQTEYRDTVTSIDDRKAERRLMVRRMQAAVHHGDAASDTAATALVEFDQDLAHLEAKRLLLQSEQPDYEGPIREARAAAQREVNVLLRKAALPALREFVRLCEQALPHWEALSRLYGYHTRICQAGSGEALSAAQVQAFPNKQSLAHLRAHVIAAYEASRQEDGV